VSQEALPVGRAFFATEFSYSVMLSAARRQPSGVEAPHVCRQGLRPVKAFPPRLTLVDSPLAHARNALQVQLCRCRDGILRLRSAAPRYAQDDRGMRVIAVTFEQQMFFILPIPGRKHATDSPSLSCSKVSAPSGISCIHSKALPRSMMTARAGHCQRERSGSHRRSCRQARVSSFSTHPGEPPMMRSAEL
jgi:hypothetical protein